jgi:hypothetical protein
MRKRMRQPHCIEASGQVGVVQQLGALDLAAQRLGQ